METEMSTKNKTDGLDQTSTKTVTLKTKEGQQQKTEPEQTCFDKLDKCNWQMPCECAASHREFEEYYDDTTKAFQWILAFACFVWPFCLGFGLKALNDSKLELTSIATVISLKDNIYCDMGDAGSGEKFLFEWQVLNSTDPDSQCLNAIFKSNCCCASKKKRQLDHQEYFVGDEVIWYHDENCDDWTELSPEQNEKIGNILLIIFWLLLAVHLLSMLVLWQCHCCFLVVSCDICIKCVGCSYVTCCCRNREYDPCHCCEVWSQCKEDCCNCD